MVRLAVRVLPAARDLADTVTRSEVGGKEPKWGRVNNVVSIGHFNTMLSMSMQLLQEIWFEA